MTPSIRIGRIAGIEVGVNWSWLAVFALLVWSLAVGVFPDQNPGLSRGAYVGMAIVATLLFFASLLGHELGHALVARREGMEIDGITLWLFGGVARFKGMFPSAGAELRIALAGPAVTLVVGAVCVAVAWAVSLPEEVDGVLAWLGYVNVVLLVFNLLPALPLDGGRVLRALLWQGRGDFRWATGVAAAVGRGFGYLFIAAGLFLFIFQGAFGGAWLAFIGWFLLQAAGSEARYVAAREALGGLRVRDVMTRDPVTVPADATVGSFMDEIAWTHRHTTYPVVEDGRVLGLLSFRCVASVPRAEWDEHGVRECMLAPAAVAELREDEPAIDALAELSATPAGRGVVLDGGRLVGMVSRSDLARALELAPRLRRPR